jgi:hypothetical protein
LQPKFRAAAYTRIHSPNFPRTAGRLPVFWPVGRRREAAGSTTSPAGFLFLLLEFVIRFCVRQFVGCSRELWGFSLGTKFRKEP